MKEVNHQQIEPQEEGTGRPEHGEVSERLPSEDTNAFKDRVLSAEHHFSGEGRLSAAYRILRYSDFFHPTDEERMSLVQLFVKDKGAMSRQYMRHALVEISDLGSNAQRAFVQAIIDSGNPFDAQSVLGNIEYLTEKEKRALVRLVIAGNDPDTAHDVLTYVTDLTAEECRALKEIADGE